MQKLIPSIMCAATLALVAAADAQSLVEIAQDNQLDGAERTAALTELWRTDSDAYVDTLGDFLNSSDIELAKYSAESLVNLVVMMGAHDMTAHTPSEDATRHDMAYVQDVFEILSENVVNTNPQVRGVITPFLVGIGNEEAFSAVAEAESSGTISGEEALGYYFAAPSDVGNSNLRSYAEGENEALAMQVISVLASDLSEQSYLRNEILPNFAYSEERRAIALGGLAQYDKNFPSYVTKPEILELALNLHQVPGSNLSGESLVAKVVYAKLHEDPQFIESYSQDLVEMRALVQGTEFESEFNSFLGRISIMPGMWP